MFHSLVFFGLHQNHAKYNSIFLILNPHFTSRKGATAKGGARASDLDMHRTGHTCLGISLASTTISTSASHDHIQHSGVQLNSIVILYGLGVSGKSLCHVTTNIVFYI